jgi:hypothetical protein
MKTASAFSIVSITLSASLSMALGIPKPRIAPPEPVKSTNFLQAITPAQASNMAIHPSRVLDFNGDGTIDILQCKGSQTRVRILDGTNRNNVLFNWEGPEGDTPSPSLQRAFTACEVIELQKGKQSIVVSAVFNHSERGSRVQSEQYLLLNTGRTLAPKVISAQQSARNGALIVNSNMIFKSAARSVQCAEFPDKLIHEGYRAGVLCFFAGYDTLSPEDWTNTAVIKFEVRDGNLIGKDLTPSSGLPWYGGIKGTPKHAFPSYRSRTGQVKIDGLHMMGGAFIDHNNDGLPDLVSVGQHASVRVSRMLINKSRAEGVEFQTSNILQAKYGHMTEFLTIAAFGKYTDKNRKPCVYISGELYDGDDRGGEVVDHVRCFERTEWVRHDLPIRNFSSSIQGGFVEADDSGRFHIRAPSYIYRNGKTERIGEEYFRVR